MFTGIIQGKGTVQSIQTLTNLKRLTITFPENALQNLQRGASIAINGACLTVTEFDTHQATFDVMLETLRLTNLDSLVEGNEVNFERAAKFGDEIGGHLLSGHIHTMAQITGLTQAENLWSIVFTIEKQWMKYILPKGFISINGASLTVGEDTTENTFSVHLIPETLEITTFASLQKGDKVNIEIDSQTQTIVNTIEKMGIKVQQ